MENQIDPWNDAEKPKTNVYWGKVSARAWYCVLEKGYGRIPFDPQVHAASRRRTCIDITITPLEETGLPFSISRNILAESYEWRQIVLPSLAANFISPRALDGKWAKIELATILNKYGEPKTYVRRSDGEIKKSTTIKFLKIFTGEDECRADYEGKDRRTAELFLRTYARAAAIKYPTKDKALEAIAQDIAGNPVVAKYYSPDDQFVIDLIEQELREIW